MAFPNLSVFFFFTFHLFLIIFCDSKCPKTFPCQNLSLEYPFTSFGRPECGLIRVDCDSSSPPKLQRGDRGTQYDVVDADFSSHKLTVRDTTLQRQLNNRDCSSFITTPLPVSPYITFMVSPNLTLFKCDALVIVGDRFADNKNYTACHNFTVYYRNPGDGNLTRDNGLLPPPAGCSQIQIPMNATGNWSDDLFNLLTYEFSVEWLVSEMEQGRSKKKVIILAAGFSAATLIVIVSSILFVFFRENLLKSLIFQKAYADKQLDFELLLKNHGSLAPKLYKYSDLKKITNSFAENLGEGGYGIAYKGKLKDGHPVAVKILKEAKGNGEEFINEVLSVSRTSHVNVVAFLGFCLEGSKRALVYEFMPNGSLEKFIPNTSSAPKFSLGVEQLFKIVVGVARGLEYLHQGCNMRILHFDIKAS